MNQQDLHAHVFGKLIERYILCLLDSKLELLDSKLELLDSKLERLDSKLDTRSIRVSRIEDRVESFEFRVTVNLHLTGTVLYVHALPKFYV